MCSDQSKLFIQKPSAGYHGFGMKVHLGCQKLAEEFQSSCNHDWPVGKKKYLIMPYLQPVLLDGHKFDVRSYALIASLDPLLVFYGDGFVRKATNKYSTENLQDTTAHITNSIQQDASKDHFWSFQRLSDYLTEHHNFPKDFMLNQFRERAIKVTEFVFQAARTGGLKKKNGRFQLFAADWIIDSTGGIHLLEVNSNPLVGTPYPGLESDFPRIWNELMSLVIKIQTGSILRSQLKKNNFVFGNWRLILNELEEDLNLYNSCNVFRDGKNSEVILSSVPTSFEQIQANLANEIKDELEIEEEEDLEKQEANGEVSLSKETIDSFTTQIIIEPTLENQLPIHENLPDVSCPSQQVVDEIRRRCILAPGSEDETIYHILQSSRPGPKVFIMGGTHGNEGAGVVASRHISRYWIPMFGTIFVLERANPRGVSANVRFVPPSDHGSIGYDLNRAFAEDSDDNKSKFLANAIWSLLEEIQPDLFIDLHEGRSFLASSLPKTIDQNSVVENVGSTTGGKISKGNSVVSSTNALPFAKLIAEACNQIINEPGRKVVVMSPPIVSGLASKVTQKFNSNAMVFETTLVFPIEQRAKQHLFMVSVVLKAAGILTPDFELNISDGTLESCVVTRKGCDVKV